MKAIVTILIASLTTAAFADSAERLDAIARAKLAGQVAVSKLFLAELRKNHAIMDAVNAHHTTNVRTIFVGVPLGVAEMLTGGAVAYKLATSPRVSAKPSIMREQERLVRDAERKRGKVFFGKPGLKKWMRANRNEIRTWMRGEREPIKDWIARNQTTVDGFLRKNEARVREWLFHDDSIVAKREVLAEYARRFDITPRRVFKHDSARVLRATFGAGLAGLLIFDGAATLASITIAPQHFDVVEARLTSFVHDAEHTLANAH